MPGLGLSKMSHQRLGAAVGLMFEPGDFRLLLCHCGGLLFEVPLDLLRLLRVMVWLTLVMGSEWIRVKLSRPEAFWLRVPLVAPRPKPG